MKSIVILDGHTLNPGDLSWEKIKQLGKITIYPRTSREEVLSRVKGAEIIVVNKVKLDAEVLENAPLCQCICVTATGYNNIAIEKARQKGIVVLNASNYGTGSVAQHVFALLLDITNRVNTQNTSVKKGDWGNQPDFCYGHETLERLEGKTIGIVGFGSIGQAVAKIADAFGMNVKVVARTAEKAINLGYEVQTFEQVISNSDIITLHIPLTNDTKNIMNKTIFQKMKKEVILINTSRGDLINEEDLYEGLKEKKPAFAALDVLKTEPPVGGHPLFNLENCIITPHVAWASKQAREKLMDMTVENILCFLEKRPFNNLAK
ncbi:MAG: D-2-hydroxyacid dehydrogenase [Bacteroidota bacterium]